MSNAIASLAVQIVADTSGFSAGVVRKDLKEIDALLRDSTPELDKYARQVKILGASWEAGSITADEYAKAITKLEAGLSRNKDAAMAAAKAESDAVAEAAKKEAAAQAAAKASYDAAVQSVEKASAAKQKYLEQLQREVMLLGKTEEETRHVTYAEMGFTKAQIASAEALHKKKAEHAANNKIFAAEIVPDTPFDGRNGLKDLAAQKAGGLPIVGDLMNAAGIAGPAGIAVAGAFAAMAAGAAGAALAVRELTSITLTAIDRLDEIGDSAQALGIEASSLQRLTIAADLADAPVEQLSDALGKMESILGDPSDEMLATFGKLGLDAEKLKNMKADQAFEAIAASIGKLGTRADQIAAVSDIFGRGNKELVNLIDSFDRVNAVAERFTLSEDQFAAVGEADLAMKELSHSFEGLQNVIGAELAPIVTDVATALAEILQSDVTQSTLYVGIVALKDTFEGLKGSIDTVNGVVTADAGGGTVGEAFLKSTDWKTQLLGKGLGLLVDPFAKQAAAEAEARRMDKERKDKAKATEAKDAAADVASGSMTEQEFNAWLKGWKEQEKAAADFQKKLADLTQSVDVFGNSQDEMRKKATDAGAANEAEIQAYVDQLKKLDEAKAERKRIDDEQREFEKALDERDRRKKSIEESLLTPEEKAKRELQAAIDVGIQGPELDLLRDKMAQSITPKITDQQVSGAAKGSQEAYTAIARSGRMTQQEKLLGEIRDSLKRQEKQEPIMVTEVVA